jgi:hypothetical protein
MSDFSLTLVLQIKTSKNHQWHGKGTTKIRENHRFWWNIFCFGQIRLYSVLCDRRLDLVTAPVSSYKEKDGVLRFFWQKIWNFHNYFLFLRSIFIINNKTCIV